MTSSHPPGGTQTKISHLAYLVLSYDSTCQFKNQRGVNNSQQDSRQLQPSRAVIPFRNSTTCGPPPFFRPPLAQSGGARPCRRRPWSCSDRRGPPELARAAGCCRSFRSPAVTLSRITTSAGFQSCIWPRSWSVGRLAVPKSLGTHLICFG